MRKFARATSGVAIFAMLMSPMVAHASGNEPNVSWPSSGGKGVNNQSLSVKLDADQYRFWKSSGGDATEKSGPAMVEAWTVAIPKQNQQASNAVGNGTGMVTAPTARELETITCYGTPKKETDDKGEETYWFSKTLIKVAEEEGWATKGESAGLCPANIDLTYMDGTKAEGAELIAGAYKKPVYSEQSLGVQKSDKAPPKNDPRCEQGVKSLNDNAKKEPIGRAPVGGKVPPADQRITKEQPFQNGCMYKTTGLQGNLSKLTGSGGMKCIRGVSSGQKYADDLSTPEGSKTAQTMAGEKWDENRGVTPVTKTKYGESPSWENCAEDTASFSFDEATMKKYGADKEVLPVGQLGRYRNKLYVYKDNPVIGIRDFGNDGAPTKVEILEHGYTTATVPLELQQACQTGFSKESYTPEEASKRDLKALTFTHYAVGENVPERYQDVRVTSPFDPSNVTADDMKRTPLSYTMTDCMYKPGVVRENSAFVCGTGDRPEGELPPATARSTELSPNWYKSEEAYQNGKIGTLDKAPAGKVDLGNGTLDITRSGDPTYLKWKAPTVVVDPSFNKGAGAKDISDLRIDKTLTLTQRYDRGDGKLENGTPFVDTPRSREMTTNEQGKEPKFKSEVLNKNVLSKFAQSEEGNGDIKGHVYPKKETDTLGGSDGEPIKPTVDQLKKSGEIDYRIHSAKTGKAIDAMTVAGTQSKSYTQMKANGQTAKASTGKDSKVPTGTITVVPDELSPSRLDNLYNAYEHSKKEQLRNGLSAIWPSRDGEPQYTSVGAQISGKFPMTVVKLKDAKADGMGNLNFNFDDQVEKRVNGQLMCLSSAVKVSALKTTN